MGQKIYWLDNLRGMACIMVVMIHASTFQVVDYSAITRFSWDVANLLNAASRVSVPLFFMISGALFFGEKSAQSRHFPRIAAPFKATIVIQTSCTLFIYPSHDSSLCCFPFVPTI